MDAGAKTFYYFGYGSNLLRQRLHLANPSAVFENIGRLADYQLVFKGKSHRWGGGGGAASILERPGSEVWGVVWKLDVKDRTSLDKQESIYTPMEVDVRDSQGETIRCLTYQLNAVGWEDLNPPSPHYKDVIVRGARQNKLPDHYLKFLERVPDNGFQGDVAIYDATMKLLSKC